MVSLSDSESSAKACETKKRRHRECDCMEWIFRCLLFLGEIVTEATGRYHSPSESALFSSKMRPKRK